MPLTKSAELTRITSTCPPGEAAPAEWLEAVAKGARWIMRKRLPANTGLPEAGLLPAGARVRFVAIDADAFRAASEGAAR